MRDSLNDGATVARMARFRYVVVDVFSDQPLQGNQLAVFTDAREIPEEQLQRLAREVNFSETTFVYPAEADGHVRMRIFTPAAEVPFAGHPTLGTAFVLAGPLQLVEIKLETGRGTVPRSPFHSTSLPSRRRTPVTESTIAFPESDAKRPSIASVDGPTCRASAKLPESLSVT